MSNTITIASAPKMPKKDQVPAPPSLPPMPKLDPPTVSSASYLNSAVNETAGSAVRWMRNPEGNATVWNNAANDLIQAFNALDDMDNIADKKINRARIYFWMGNLLKYLPKTEISRIDRNLLIQIEKIANAKNNIAESTRQLYAKSINYFKGIPINHRNINVEVERAGAHKELGEYYLGYSDFIGNSYLGISRSNILEALTILLEIKNGNEMVNIESEVKIIASNLQKINSKSQKEKALCAETIAILANYYIELYKKDGKGNDTQIQKLIDLAKNLNPIGALPNTVKITGISIKFELLQLKNKINEAVSKLEQARKGCTAPKAEQLKKDGKEGLEASKASLLKVLDKTLIDPELKKVALFLYCEALSKQDYDEEAAIKETNRIYTEWEVKSKSGKPIEIKIQGKNISGIGAIDRSKDLQILNAFSIVKIKLLISESTIIESQGKIEEADKKLTKAKEAASDIILGKNFSKAIKNEAVILYLNALFRLNGEALGEGLKLSLKWIEKGFVGGRRADGQTGPIKDSDGGWAVSSDDPAISAIMDLADIADQIKDANYENAKSMAFSILANEVEPFFKKHALYLYCEALYKQGIYKNDKDLIAEAERIYASWEMQNFSGTILFEFAVPKSKIPPQEIGKLAGMFEDTSKEYLVLKKNLKEEDIPKDIAEDTKTILKNAIKQSKISCIENIDKSKDLHILGSRAIVHVKNLIDQGKYSEAMQAAVNYQAGKYRSYIIKKIGDLYAEADSSNKRLGQKAEAPAAAAVPVEAVPPRAEAAQMSPPKEEVSPDQRLLDMAAITEIKKNIEYENYDAAVDPIFKLLKRKDSEAYLKKDALWSYFDLLLRESTKESISEAQEGLKAWKTASEAAAKKGEETVSITIKGETYSGIERIYFDRQGDSHIISAEHIAKIRILIEEEKHKEANEEAIKFLDQLKINNPYKPYVKTQAVMAYLETLLRDPNEESTKEAEEIILAWKKDDYKNTLTIRGKQYEISSLKSEEGSALLAYLYRQIGITHYATSNFETAVNSFKKAEEADPSSPINYIYSGRALLLAEGFRSDREYQEKYEKALGLIYAKLPKEIREKINKKEPDKFDLQNNLKMLENDSSEEYKTVIADPNGRLLLLTALEYNSRIALSKGDDISAETYTTKARDIYEKLVKDNARITFGYIFKSQLHYDLAEIYRYQSRYSEALKEYYSVLKVERRSNWWLERQINILANNSFGLNSNLPGSVGIAPNLSLTPSPLAPELYYKGNGPDGSLKLPIKGGAISTSSLYLGWQPQIDTSKKSIQDNTFVGNASLFVDTAKTKSLSLYSNASTSGKMNFNVNYRQPIGGINTFSVGLGFGYISDGSNDKILQPSISPEYRLSKSLTLGAVYKPNYHFGNIGGEKNNFFTHEASVYSSYTRRIFNNLSLKARTEIGYVQEAQNEYSRAEEADEEIPTWNWFVQTEKDGGGEASYTRMKKSPEESGDPKHYKRKYYWVKDYKYTSSGTKAVWHVEAGLISETKQFEVPVNNPQNPYEKIIVDLKTIRKYGFNRKDGDPIKYGLGNEIVTDENSKPSDDEINKIDMIANPLAVSEEVYSEGFTQTTAPNGETVVTVFDKKDNKNLYRMRTVHTKTADGLPKLLIYKLDFEEGKAVPPIPDSAELQSGEEIVYESYQGKTMNYQNHFSEKLSVGLEWENKYGVFGFAPFVEGNQFTGVVTKTSKPNDDYYSYGASVYGNFFLGRSWSVSPSITLRGNHAISKQNGNSLTLPLEVGASIGASVHF